MSFSLRHVASAFSLLALAGLAVGGCSSGSGDAAHDAPPPSSGGHDHAGHDHGAPKPDSSGSEQDQAGHNAPATPTPGLSKIEPSGAYPLETCVVSGDALDAMGDPLAYDYNGTEVQFCCEGCVDEFLETPDVFLKQIQAAKKR